MTISRVQGNFTHSSAGAPTKAVTLSSAVTSGNAIVGGIFIFSNSITPSIQDDQGNTYTVVGSINETNDFIQGVSFYLTNITNAPTTITATFGSSLRAAISAEEFSGIATSSALDGHNENAFTGNTTTYTSNSFTTTAAGDLVWGAATGNPNFQTPIPDAGWTTGFSDAAFDAWGSQYQVQSSAGSIAVTGTFTFNTQYWAIGLALKAAPPAVTYISPRPRIRPVVRTYYVR